MDADENIYALVFGESIFNDAISIVMYNTVTKMGDNPDDSNAYQVWEAFYKFVTIFFGSIIVGAMIALTVAFVLKRQSQYSELKVNEDDTEELIEEKKNKH